MNIAIKPENISSREALAGKVSVVTGSTSGIGLGIARALAAAGSEIVLNGFGKPEEVADAQARIAAEFKVRVSYSPSDMSKPKRLCGASDPRVKVCPALCQRSPSAKSVTSKCQSQPLNQ
jgi:3-hydroxybutyrate dehydrogenase